MLRPTYPLALAITLLALSGCSSHQAASPAASSSTPATAPAGTKSHIMLFSGRPVLRLTAPADAECELSNGGFALKSRDGYVNIWLVRDAATIEQGAQRAPEVIVSEFKDFKPTSKTPLTLPGSGPDASALGLFGSGVEADDNDPGTADVIIFRKGGRIFIACTHGETLRPSAQALSRSLVQSSTAP